MSYIRIDPKDNVMFCILEADVQFEAKRIIKRELNEDELDSVKKGLEWGLGDCQWIVIKAAILEAIELNE